MSQTDFDITRGVDKVVWNAIDKSIESDNKDTFFALHKFVIDVIYLSIAQKDLRHFTSYVNFLSHYYSNSKEKISHRSTLTKIHDVCSQQAAISLRDILWLGIGIINQKVKTVADQEKVNQFYYSAFVVFERVLFFAVKNKDFEKFSLFVEQFDIISDSNSQQTHQLRTELRRLVSMNTGGAEEEKIVELKKQIDLSNQFQKYRRHVIMGIRYWIIYLHRLKRFNQKNMLRFLKLIPVPHVDSRELLADVLFFKSLTLSNYMEWQSWDYKERIDGKSYTLPYPPDWMSFGFIADQIRENRLYLNTSEFDSAQLSAIQVLRSELQSYLPIFIKDLEKWKKFFGVETEDALRVKVAPLESLFNSAHNQANIDNEATIATTPLSNEKVSNFKNLIGQAWKNQARIRKLFDKHRNKELIETTDIELLLIGQRTFFERAKIHFIDGPLHSSIYGIEQMGGQTGRWEDDEFFNTLLTSDHNKSNGANIVETIDHMLADMAERGVVPDILIFQAEYTYRDVNLTSSQRFVAKNLLNNEVEPGFFHLGEFDKIPVYSSFSVFLNGRVFAMNFSQAIKMQYRQNTDWYDNLLKVTVSEVPDQAAQARLLQEPEKWRRLENGQNRSNEAALRFIKTSVIIDIFSTLRYVITNKNAYQVGYIKGERNADI